MLVDRLILSNIQFKMGMMQVKLCIIKGQTIEHCHIHIVPIDNMNKIDPDKSKCLVL